MNEATATMETLRKLAQARDEAAIVKEQVDLMLETFKNDPAYKILSDKLAELKQEQQTLREIIEADALEIYNSEDGLCGKSLFDGFVKIRETKNYKVGNPDLVRAWVTANAPMLLEVNDKALVKMAKSSGAIPASIVRVDEEKKVAIATDLSGLIG